MNEIKVSSESTSGDITKSMLNIALKEIMAIVNAECGSLFLFDTGHKELVLNVFYNLGDLNLAGLRKKVGEGIAGQVANLKSPILVKDINSDMRFRRNGFAHYRTNSFISIPLMSAKGILGLINLADKSSGQPFSEKDLEFASAVAKYTCMSIDMLTQNSALKKYANVGKLAAGLVHEINNPLDGVLRYANILLAQMEDNQVAREYLLEIRTGLNRIAGITRSLLEFSHVVNSIPAKEKRYANVNHLIDECLTMFSRDLSRNIQIYKKYTEPSPDVLDLGLQQVFTNMIENAIDAMVEGGALSIYTGVNDSSLNISFKDTGIGISNELSERIFEPFFTTKPKDKGTGLGLAISKEIIARYAGDIEVDSIPGKGTMFTITIPLKYIKNG